MASGYRSILFGILILSESFPKEIKKKNHTIRPNHGIRTGRQFTNISLVFGSFAFKLYVSLHKLHTTVFSDSDPLLLTELLDLDLSGTAGPGPFQLCHIFSIGLKSETFDDHCKTSTQNQTSFV